MPIFEYVCRNCEHQFEKLVSGASQPECPTCSSQDLTRQLSVFAVNSKSAPASRPAAGPCGTCGDPRGPGSCAIDRN